MTGIKNRARPSAFKVDVEPTPAAQEAERPLQTEAPEPSRRGVLLPPDKERYEQALSIEQKLIAASMGQVEPRRLARAQKLEMGLVQEAEGHPKSELAQAIKENGPAVALQLQALAAGVSQQELRETISEAANRALQKGDTQSYGEMVECIKGLDSAKSLIDDYERTLREMPRQSRPQGAGLGLDMIDGVDNALFGMVDPMGMAAMSFMPGMFDAFGGYPYMDPYMEEMIGHPLMTGQGHLDELGQTMDAGPRRMEGYYNQSALDSMGFATDALEKVKEYLRKAGIDPDKITKWWKDQTSPPESGASSSTAADQQKQGATSTTASVDEFLGRGPINYVTGGEGKNGPRFAIKVGKDTLALSHSKSGALRWKLRGAAYDSTDPPKGRVDAAVAQALLDKLKAHDVSDSSKERQQQLSELALALERVR